MVGAIRRVVVLSVVATLTTACTSGTVGGRMPRGAARRVISLVPAATDFIVALGAGDRLVARTDYDRDPRLQDVPAIGAPLNPNAERIVALRPDLVVSWQDLEPAAVLAQLRQLGIPVREVRMETLADVRRTIRDLGRWLGCPAKADSMLGALDDTLAAVRVTGARHAAVRAFYLVQLGPPMTTGPGTFVDDLLTLAGARNIFADAPVDWPTVALESIARRNPDLVIWPLPAGDTRWSDRLGDRPSWTAVPAVRDGRVLVVDRDLMDRPGPTLGTAARRLAQAVDSFAATHSGGGGPRD